MGRLRMDQVIAWCVVFEILGPGGCQHAPGAGHRVVPSSTTTPQGVMCQDCFNCGDGSRETSKQGVRVSLDTVAVREVLSPCLPRW
jgi:hypothetical protein